MQTKKWPGEDGTLQVKRQGGRNRSCVRTKQKYNETPGLVKHYTKKEIKKYKKGGE